MRYTFWAERCILKERIAERLGQDMKKTVITTARSYGSGGKTLGNLLAKDLGINCYSREILRMASDESGINVEYFRRKAVILYQMTIFSIIRQRLSRILPHRSHALSLAAVQIMF